MSEETLTNDNKPSCYQCRFWKEITEESLYEDGAIFYGFGAMGHCKFNPPSLDFSIPKNYWGEKVFKRAEIEELTFAAQALPITHCEDWCGRFQKT